MYIYLIKIGYTNAETGDELKWITEMAVNEKKYLDEEFLEIREKAKQECIEKYGDNSLDDFKKILTDNYGYEFLKFDTSFECEEYEYVELD